STPCQNPRMDATETRGGGDGCRTSCVMNVLRSVSVDLNVDPSLQIDIPDALSERDKVKFTVHTKTTLPTFQSPEFSVTRQHEDIVWLHDMLIETTDYAGLIIPPAPTKPDFDGPQEKMQKLGEDEGSMTKEEFAKMKQELEAEYLTFLLLLPVLLGSYPKIAFPMPMS
uniref:PX domain-containing protein n=1 Tax=Spermophilus dauricus TaxID=99837 RepID=A0A8C9UPV6_SPEDA